MSLRKYRCLSNDNAHSGVYTLIPIRDQDKFLIMKWRNEQIYHLRQEKLLTELEQENYFKTVVDDLFIQDKPNQILFSFLENSKCVGYGGLVHVNWADKIAEISFLMNTELENDFFTEYWSNYLKMLESIAFKELKLHKIFTYAYDIRPKLFKVLEDANYVLEARLKEHCIVNGNYKDVLIHSKFDFNSES